MKEKVPVSVVIPTYKRVGSLIKSINEIATCRPLPDEVIVHFDGNDVESMLMMKSAEIHLNVETIISSKNVGPGGGRDILIRKAKNEIVVSFDDDSYPVDTDFFLRVIELMNRYKDISILGASITHRFEDENKPFKKIYSGVGFVGCGCVYRRSDYLKVDGYIPIPLAYGAEETDLALQYLNKDLKISLSPWIRVFHDTELKHHEAAKITAATVSNLFLLTYLRYPFVAVPYGILQVINRIFWLISHGRRRGIVQGVFKAPSLLWKFKKHRKSVPLDVLKRFKNLREPVLIIEF